MARRVKKKTAKKAKKATKKTAAKKTAKKKVAKSAKRAPVRKAKKAPARKTAARKTTAKKAARKTTTKRKGDVKGEGNYSASRRFRKKEEGFIARMGSKIAELGHDAKVALTGPEGKDLEAAEASSRARGEGMDVEKE